MRPEFIVAVKEFKDYLTSWRFLLIFAVLLLMCIAAVVAGINSYNSQVATYNTMLQHPVNSTSTRAAVQPTMPSMMIIFRSFTNNFISVGWLLAIAIGFDLISKEKETGSLKLLLVRPTFRDSIINGKLIGSMSILIISLAATFLIGVAILLFEGIIPAGDDLIRLITFFLMIVLFCITFLSIAIAASAIAKNSTVAILLAIGCVVFSLLLPGFATTVSDVALGQAPSMTIPSAATSGSSTSGSSGTSGSSTSGSTGATRGGGAGGFGGGFGEQINPAYTSYINKQNAINEAIDLLSPTSDLNSIATVVVDRAQNPMANSAIGAFSFASRGMSAPTLGSTLPSLLPQILALIVITIAGFAVSYAKFIRMDVR